MKYKIFVKGRVIYVAVVSTVKYWDFGTFIFRN